GVPRPPRLSAGDPPAARGGKSAEDTVVSAMRRRCEQRGDLPAQHFRLLRGDVELFSFPDHPRELFAAKRTITVNSEYLERFIAQGVKAEAQVARRDLDRRRVQWRPARIQMTDALSKPNTALERTRLRVSLSFDALIWLLTPVKTLLLLLLLFSPALAEESVERKSIGTISSIDEISHIHIANLLRANGIECSMPGHGGIHALMVPSD